MRTMRIPTFANIRRPLPLASAVSGNALDAPGRFEWSKTVTHAYLHCHNGEKCSCQCAREAGVIQLVEDQPK